MLCWNNYSHYSCLTVIIVLYLASKVLCSGCRFALVVCQCTFCLNPHVLPTNPSHLVHCKAIIIIIINNNNNTHTSDANQCSAVAFVCGPSQRLPIPPASGDWPAQDEIDIMGCTPLYPHCSAGTHTAVCRWWEENRREK